jgi:hypothetical protein
MRARHLYLAFCLIGTVLPLSAFLPFVALAGARSRLFLALGLPLFLYMRERRLDGTRSRAPGAS